MSMSQDLSPFSDPSFLRLPLLKYSFASHSASHSGPFPWTHYSGNNDLFAVFETVNVETSTGLVEARQKLKILKDPDFMEDLDIKILSEEAHRAMAIAHDPITHSNDPRVVAVVVRAPLIAMRYPLSMGQVRRFQVRFANNEYYYEAMKMLARANIPTVEAGSFPTPKPQTMNDAANNHATNVSKPASSHSRAAEISSVQPIALPALPIAQNGSTNLAPSEVFLRDQNIHTPPNPRHNLSTWSENQPYTEVTHVESTEIQGSRTTEVAVHSNHDPISLPSTHRTTSTAAKGSQSLEYLLPAKRDPPFEKPMTRSKSLTAKKQNKDNGNALKMPAPVTKRKASTTKAPNNAKTRKAETATSREKAEPQNLRQETASIPSVNDLYQCPNSFQPQNTAMNSATLDTQALLSRVDKLAQTRVQPTKPTANQSLCESNTREVVASIENNQAKTSHVPEGQDVVGAGSYSPATNTVRLGTRSEPNLTQSTEALTILMNDAAFAQSATKLHNWNTLQADDQREALRRFVCLQYQDPVFLNLCRTLHGIWETMMVYPGKD